MKRGKLSFPTLPPEKIIKNFVGEEKTKKLVILLLVLLFCRQSRAGVYIDSISIFPPQPEISDIITVSAEGWSGTNFIGIDFTNFTGNDRNLQWDIYCAVGVLAIVDSWNYWEPIGTLEAGEYDLTVTTSSRVGFSGYYHLDDTKHMSFTVVPEPATLLLFGLGGLALRRKRRG